MKPLFLLLFSLYSLGCFFSSKKCEYTFRARDFEELYVEEPIYFNGNKVGKVKTMFFDSSLSTGFGKLSFINEFKVSANMQFISKKTFLGSPTIQIETRNNLNKGKLNCKKDTITILTPKSKKD